VPRFISIEYASGKKAVMQKMWRSQIITTRRMT